MRIKAIDLVRGATVAGMILVNNGHSGSFECLRHEAWNGLSLSDFVFPFFLFIMGVSMYVSMSKGGFQFNRSVFWKIAKRTVLLFAIGIAINWTEMALDGRALLFEELRFWAVMQRIALCYFAVSIFALTCPHRWTIPTVIGILAVYAGILYWGNGYSLERAANFLYRADAWFVGDSHLYHKSAVDPEGLVGTLSSIANVLLGFYVGKKLKESPTRAAVFIAGTAMTFAGFVLNYAMPYNKRIWSPSFALITSGFCTLLLAWVAEKEKDGKASTFFMVFGRNALALYIVSELMAIVFGAIGISDAIFSVWSVIPVPQLASLAYALTYVMMNWLIGYALYRRKIFIKL